MHHNSFFKSGLSCFAVMLSIGSIVLAQPSAFINEGESSDWERLTAQDNAPAADPVQNFIDERSLLEKVSQLILVTLEGVTGPSVNDLAFFKSSLPGGVVMPHAFKPASAAAYINVLREIERGSGLPLLIGADLYQIISPTRTAPKDFIQLPSLMSITAAGESDTTQRLAGFMAEHARGMGLNLHLGPPLTLAPTLTNALSTTQTFGSDPKFAAEAGRIFLEAFTHSGILMMPMGYPGGGADRTAKTAAVLTTPRPLLADTDALPYHELIRAEIQMVHVGNTLVPTLDMNNHPASLSAVVMSDILRKEAGFSGVIVAGPLDEDVLQARYESSEAAEMALTAGADLLYFQNGLLPALRAAERITRAVTEGRISEERIHDSLRRILALKQAMPKPEKPTQEREAAKLADQKELVEASMSIERRAITLVKNTGNILPLEKKISTPAGITGTAGVDELHALLEKRLKPVSQQRITTAQHIGEIQRFEIDRLTRNINGLRTVICILTDSVRVETQLELVQALKKNGASLVVIYLGNPRNAARLLEADALLLAYCDPVMLSQTMIAMADILMGEGPVSILPIDNEIHLKIGEQRSFNAFDILRVPSGRLPVALNDKLPAGISARYNPEKAVKHVEWDLDGKHSRKTNIAHAFNKPGVYPITLTITDTQDDIQTRTFTVNVTE